MRKLLCLATLVVANACFGQASFAGYHLFYQEDFAGATAGVTGAPGSFTEAGEWSIDATGTNLLNANDFARQQSGSFALRDLGGNSSGGATSGMAVFSTLPAGTSLPGGAWTFLTSSLSVSIAAASVGSSVLVESYVNGALTDSTLLTAVGTHNVTHNLADNVIAPGAYTYELRVTVTQDISTTYFLDNIIVQGNSTPEPASLSMLGMGLLGLCGAGYRRRRKLSVTE